MIDEIRNAQGERLDFTWSGEYDARDLVVIGHGVTANKDRPFLVALSEGMRASGVASLRVSFAGNGESEGRFEEATITKEVEDLGAVLDALEGRRVIYVGHSMGAAVGVIRAARDARIAGLVSLAGMVHTRDFAERKFGTLTPGRDRMWDKPECPFSQKYMDDMTRIDSVVELAATISIPWLLVHGTADQVVLPRDATDIRAAAGGRQAFAELDGADHVFGGDATAAMVLVVVPWLVETLSHC
ncbi:MAG: alpha/beta hydrolase [Gemmatimonadetes bacterium]|nr:alpha/beta hydrolase [Gemmatimonadota bacterium]